MCSLEISDIIYYPVLSGRTVHPRGLCGPGTSLGLHPDRVVEGDPYPGERRGRWSSSGWITPHMSSGSAI